MLNLERDSLILITPDEALRKRFLQACEYLIYKPTVYSSAEQFLADDKVKPHTVFYDGGQDITGLRPTLEKLEASFHDEVELYLVAETNEATLLQMQNLFLNHLIDRQQYSEAFITEFLIFHRGLCNFYEINVQDLFPDTVIPFNAYHYLPLNQKYVTLVNENLSLSEAKFKKIESAKVLTIHRESVNAYNDYIEYYFDRFSVGLKKRFRAKYYQIFSQWRESVITGLTAHPKPDLYPGSLDDLTEQLKLISEYLQESPDPWQLIFEAAQSPLLNYERSALELIVSTALASHVQQLQIEKLVDLKWALACCRMMTPSMFFKKRHNSTAPLKPEDEVILKAFPQQLPIALKGELQKDFFNYSEGFITQTQPSDNNALFATVYMGEKIVESIASTDSRAYSRTDILQGALARAKNESRLNQAWMEQFRILFTNGTLNQKKDNKETP